MLSFARGGLTAEYEPMSAFIVLPGDGNAPWPDTLRWSEAEAAQAYASPEEFEGCAVLPDALRRGALRDALVDSFGNPFRRCALERMTTLLCGGADAWPSFTYVVPRGHALSFKVSALAAAAAHTAAAAAAPPEAGDDELAAWLAAAGASPPPAPAGACSAGAPPRDAEEYAMAWLVSKSGAEASEFSWLASAPASGHAGPAALSASGDAGPTASARLAAVSAGVPSHAGFTAASGAPAVSGSPATPAAARPAGASAAGAAAVGLSTETLERATVQVAAILREEGVSDASEVRATLERAGVARGHVSPRRRAQVLLGQCRDASGPGPLYRAYTRVQKLTVGGREMTFKTLMEVAKYARERVSPLRNDTRLMLCLHLVGELSDESYAELVRRMCELLSKPRTLRCDARAAPRNVAPARHVGAAQLTLQMVHRLYPTLLRLLRHGVDEQPQSQPPRPRRGA